MNNLKNKKVLVTGGSGFIGSHLVDRLADMGAKVTVSSSGNNLKNLSQSIDQISVVKADLRNPQDCQNIVKNQEMVFNLAAVVGGIEFNRIHPGTLFRDNSLIGINMLEAARIEGVDKFLAVSSACVYHRNAPVPTKESEGFVNEPEPTNYGYGWAKRVSELAAKTYHEEFSMPIAVVRPYNAYGPRDHFNDVNAHVIPSLVTRIFQDENPLTVWGDGSPTRAFIYVQDVVTGMIDAIQRSNNANPINLGTEEEISIQDLVKMIMEISGKSLDIKFDKTKPNGQPRRNCDISKAKRSLNFIAQTSLHDGLKETIDWYREKYNK